MWKVTLYINSYEKLVFIFDTPMAATNFLTTAIIHKESECKGKIEYIDEEEKEEEEDEV